MYMCYIIRDVSPIRILVFHSVVFHNHLMYTADLRTKCSLHIVIWVLKTSNKFSPNSFTYLFLFSSIPKFG